VYDTEVRQYPSRLNEQFPAKKMSMPSTASAGHPHPLTPAQIALILSEFRRQFGEDPKSVHVGGSYSEQKSGPTSDMDVLIETDLVIPRFSQPWFDYLRAIEPGMIPPSVTGVGAGPGQAFINNDPGDIPKAGLLDPFFKLSGTIYAPTIKVV
jgi:hypothetical protein